MTESRSTALAIPTSLEEVKGLAQAFVQSGMFTDVKQLSQAIVKIQAGRELGLPPVYSMQNINLIRNRLTTSANTMAMLVKRSGNYNYRIKEHTDTVCTITFYERDGDKWLQVGESSFSMDDAKRAELLKPDSGWEKFPRAMLFSRAISQGARIYAPDAIGGIYTDEEIRAIPPRPEEGESTEVKSEVKETPVIPPSMLEKQPPEGLKPEPSLLHQDLLFDTALLIEDLKTIKWHTKDYSTARSWLAQFKIDTTGNIVEVVSRLDGDQLTKFLAEIDKRKAG